MPPLDDNDMELDSSTSAETLDVASTTDTADTDATAASSTPQGESDDSTLSIVRDVVDAKKVTSEAASPAEGQEAGTNPGGQETSKKEPDDENYSDVPFHKHPRFQHLLRQQKAYKEDAGRYQKVQDFMDVNGISAEEAADGFVIMGLMKTDPQAAWEKLKPHVQKLLVAAGEVLPDDLQQRVQRGELSQDAAFEVSRSRATVNTVEANRSFEEQRTQRRATVELANSLIDTATAWEEDRRLKDPNFEAKLVPLKKELAWIQSQEGKPQTPAGVQDQLRRAYEAVKVVPAQPAARPRPQPRPQMGAQISGTATPKPETTLDIIRQARARR